MEILYHRSNSFIPTTKKSLILYPGTIWIYTTRNDFIATLYSLHEPIWKPNCSIYFWRDHKPCAPHALDKSKSPPCCFPPALTFWCFAMKPTRELHPLYPTILPGANPHQHSSNHNLLFSDHPFYFFLHSFLIKAGSFRPFLNNH